MRPADGGRANAGLPRRDAGALGVRDGQAVGAAAAAAPRRTHRTLRARRVDARRLPSRPHPAAAAAPRDHGERRLRPQRRHRLPPTAHEVRKSIFFYSMLFTIVTAVALNKDGFTLIFDANN